MASYLLLFASSLLYLLYLDSSWHAFSIMLCLCRSPYLVPVRTYYKKAPMAFAIDQLWLPPRSDSIRVLVSMRL